ncbi:MAG: hypothetical protein ACOX63_10800 [Christensenellales bacterium]|jgi:hypothetical protein
MEILKKCLLLNRQEIEIGGIQRCFDMAKVSEKGKAQMEAMEKKWQVTYPRGKDYSFAYRAPFGVRFEVEQAQMMSFGIKANRQWEALVSYASVQYDEEDKLYRFWYSVSPGTAAQDITWAGKGENTDCSFMGYAESKDGLQWEKPELGYWEWQGHPTNLTLNGPGYGIGLNKPGEKEKYLAFYDQCEEQQGEDDKRTPQERSYITVGMSRDGIHWHDTCDGRIDGFFDSENILTYDPFLKKYVGYLRGRSHGRCIMRVESDDLKTFTSPQVLFRPDNEDPLDADFYTNGFCFYPHDESIRLLFPTVYMHRSDLFNIRMAVSYDGRAFDWVSREYVTDGRDLNGKEIKAFYAMHNMVPLADRIGIPILYQDHYHERTFHEWFYGLPTAESGYLWATWKKDRLGGLRADTEGEFWSKPFIFDGNCLLINGHTHGLGRIRAEVYYSNLNPEVNNDVHIMGRTLEEGDDMRGDIDWQPYTWNKQNDLGMLRGKPAVIRFKLQNAKMFGFAVANRTDEQ